MSDDFELEVVEQHRDYLLAILRGGSLRAKMIEAEICAIGVALKNNMIGPETAVRWLYESKLLDFVGPMPESTGKLAYSDRPVEKSIDG